MSYLKYQHTNQFKLWKWISTYYMANIGDVMNAALPSNFKLGSETKVSIHPEFDRNYENLSDKEYLIIEAIDLQEELTLKEVSEIVEIKTIQPLIKSLIEKKAAIVSEELKSKYLPKYKSFVQVSPNYKTDDDLGKVLNDLESSSRNKKQVDTLLRVIQMTNWSGETQLPVLKKELLDKGVSDSSLATLNKKGILEIFTAEISRLEESNSEVNQIKELSENQHRSYTEIKEHFNSKEVVLLHGVTSSGKTEIYVKLIKETLDKGEQVLYLLPEIALTAQLINRLRKYFGDLVGVYHSRFNQNERIEIWNKVLTNNQKQFRVILGARSSIFLPFQNLGLIVV